MTKSPSSERRPHPAGNDQRQRFIETARELGCDEDEEAFKRKLKRIAEAPVADPAKARKVPVKGKSSEGNESKQRRKKRS